MVGHTCRAVRRQAADTIAAARRDSESAYPFSPSPDEPRRSLSRQISTVRPLIRRCDADGLARRMPTRSAHADAVGAALN